MFFNKKKHSFLIIEILLGFFLLAIFTSIFISIPKITINPLIDKAIKNHFYHLSDKDFFLILKNIQIDKLPTKKGTHYTSEEEKINLIVSNFFKGQCKKKFTITLKEIKTTPEGDKIFLYECIVSIATVNGNPPISAEIPYGFIIKQYCN
jgi:hypothetical protein